MTLTERGVYNEREMTPCTVVRLISASTYRHDRRIDSITYLKFCVITHAHGSCGGRVFPGVCLSVFHAISQKPMQLGPPNVTHKCSTTSPGNPLILGSKVTSQGHESQKQCWCGRCTLVSAGFFLVSYIFTSGCSTL